MRSSTARNGRFARLIWSDFVNFCTMSPSRGKPDGEKPGSILSAWTRQYGLALEFLAYLAVLGYVGSRIDARYGSNPWGLFIGLLLGLAAGLYRMIREAKNIT